MKHTFLSLLAVLFLTALLAVPALGHDALQEEGGTVAAPETVAGLDLKSVTESSEVNMSRQVPQPAFMQGPYPGHAACFDFHDACSTYCAINGYLYYSANCNNATCTCYN